MKTERNSGRTAVRSMVPAVMLCALPVAAIADPLAGPVRVDVYPGYYSADGKRFAELGRLEHWVNQKGVKALVFHACMGSANAKLTDAIERFRAAYIDVRWIDAGTKGCPAAASAGRS